jgi:hypothetical protein
MMQMQRQMPTIDLPPPEDALPPGWKAGVDKAGSTYFYNKELNVSQWTRPEVATFGGGLAQGGRVAGGLTSKGTRSAPCFCILIFSNCTYRTICFMKYHENVAGKVATDMH